MKLARMMKVLTAAGFAALFVFALAACSNSGSAASATAATVNGTAISEDEVTKTIQNVRSQYSLDTEDAWGKFLASNNETPQSVREGIIDSLVNQELLKAGAEELGVTVDESKVDEAVESLRANFDSDEKFDLALSGAGYTEESYRESITNSLIQQAVSAHFEQESQPSDEDLLESAKMYASYYNGAKRSSHILFAADDEATARDVLARIKAGTLDFAEAAKQYSTDSSAENGGDVGWDRASTFVAAYQDALDALALNEVSDLVVSDYGIHIIKCTEIYNAPEEVTSIEDLPEAFRGTITSQAASIGASQKEKEWLDGLREKADIVVNDMPADVPYNIDVEKYKTSDESASAEAAATDESAEEGTEGSDAAAETASDASASAEASSASASSESASN